LADLKIEAKPPKEAILLTLRDRMAQPPLGLGRRLRPVCTVFENAFGLGRIIYIFACLFSQSWKATSSGDEAALELCGFDL
jgi:hypothetical protein